MRNIERIHFGGSHEPEDTGVNTTRPHLEMIIGGAAIERRAWEESLKEKIKETMGRFEEKGRLENVTDASMDSVVPLVGKDTLQALQEKGLISETMVAEEKVSILGAVSAVLINNPDTQRILLTEPDALDVVRQEVENYIYRRVS